MELQKEIKTKAKQLCNWTTDVKSSPPTYPNIPHTPEAMEYKLKLLA